MRPASFVLAVAIAAIAAPFARADNSSFIVIEKGTVKPVPLAISHFQGPKDQAEALYSAVADDFALAGIFDLVDPRSFLADEKVEGIAAPTIDFSKWSAVGAQLLVKAMVIGDSKSSKAELRLF